MLPTSTPSVTLTEELSNAIITAARECIGTPFRHQGRRIHRGLDCVGLVRYPAVQVGFAKDAIDCNNYGRYPIPPTMADLLERYFEPITPDIKAPGDIMWMWTASPGMPQHLGIWCGDTMIHAMMTGPKKVVEHPFKHPFSTRVVGWYRYKYLG